MNTTETITVPALGVGETATLTVPADCAELVRALAPHILYGPDYSRGAWEQLGRAAHWGRLYAETGDDYYADLCTTSLTAGLELVTLASAS